MAETTETAPIQTDAVTTKEAAATSLLTSTDPATTQQQQSEMPKTPDGEAKPAAETKTETEKTAEAKPEGAPDKYEFKAPEGKEFDSAILDTFSAAAKQANLTQDAAQKLLESMAPALAERQQAQIQAVQKGWLEATQADKEFGGEKLNENLAVARTALDRFASPELKTLLNTTGLGNNPEVIRAFYKVGKAISEDKFVSGPGAPAGKADVTAILYGNTPKK